MNIAELLDELEGRDPTLIVAIVLDADGGEVQDGDVLHIVEAKVQLGQFHLTVQPLEDE